MPRSRGWKDYIPASGEGRALVEVKGKIGRGAKRSSMRSRFSRMRKGQSARKPLRLIPLSPGPMDTPVVEQTQQVKAWNGHAGIDIKAEWLFAFTTDDVDPGAGQQYPPMFNQTLEANRPERLRIVGLHGNLWWHPLLPLTPGSPEAFTGMVGWAWLKLEASIVSSVGSGSTPSFPYNLWQAAGASVNIATAGMTPSIPNLSDPLELTYRDWRARAGRIMNMGCLPWKIDGVYDVLEERLFPGPSNAVRIPLPRRVICNIGQGEALACVVWVKDNGSSASLTGSPVGQFTFHDVYAKAYELA